MDIVACTDNNYVMPTGVMMYSVCVNNQETEITFHVVTDKVHPYNLKKLKDTISQFRGKSIVFYDAEMIEMSEIPPMEANAYLTIVTYFRLFLTEILPSTVNKVIYLDDDIIVRQPLKPLWEYNLDGIAIAAVPEAHCTEDSFYERLGYPKEMGYFNAGVLLINLKYWREHRLLSIFKDFMLNNADQIVYHDQDVLNYTLRNSKKELPIKYNLQAAFLWSDKNYALKYEKEVMSAIHNPAILHYTGAKKPWCKSFRHPFCDSFYKYQSQTIWKDEPLQEDRPLKLRIIKFFSGILRKLRLIPELPPYGEGFISELKPLD